MFFQIGFWIYTLDTSALTAGWMKLRHHKTENIETKTPAFVFSAVAIEVGVIKLYPPKKVWVISLPAKITPWKIDMECKHKGLEHDFLFHWVIFRFQPFIFWVTSRYSSVVACTSAALDESPPRTRHVWKAWSPVGDEFVQVSNAERCSQGTFWKKNTLPETNSFAPENGGLENDCCLFGWPIFRGFCR